MTYLINRYILTTVVVNSKLIKSFFNIGFSEYETKAYCSLLTNSPSSPYEIAKESMIPSSKIYGVLAKLLEKNVVIEIAGNKNKYVAVDPEEIIDRYRSDTNSTLNFLETQLSELKKDEDFAYIWNINDYSFLINKAFQIIENSKKTILISIWKEEMNRLENALEIAEKKNKSLSIVHFGVPDRNIGQVFKHPIEDTLYNEKNGRSLVIVADSDEVLMGTIFEDGRVDGAYSKNKGFVMMAEDYLKHDIYIMKIVKRFNKELIEKFGNNYHLLRDVFSDKEVL